MGLNRATTAAAVVGQINIIVTGGTGFRGFHPCVALAQACHELVILDNLSKSGADVIDRVATLWVRRPAVVQCGT